MDPNQESPQPNPPQPTQTTGLDAPAFQQIPESATTPPPPPPATAPQAPKPKSPILMVAVIMLLLSALGATGYFAYQNYFLKQPSPTPAPSSPTPSPSADPTANWKTYINTALGFSFKYPNDYFKFQQDYPDIGVYLAPSQGEGGNGPKFLKPDDVWIDATISSGANLKSLDEYLILPGQQIFPTNAQKTPTTIDGTKGYIIVYSLPISAGDITQYTKAGIVLRNEKIYTISLSAWSQDVLLANQTMSDQILSTFRFTSVESPTPSPSVSPTPTSVPSASPTY